MNLPACESPCDLVQSRRSSSGNYDYSRNIQQHGHFHGATNISNGKGSFLSDRKPDLTKNWDSWGIQDMIDNFVEESAEANEGKV